jgi:hypothetical protein
MDRTEVGTYREIKESGEDSVDRRLAALAVAGAVVVSVGGCGPVYETYTDQATEKGITEIRLDGGSGDVRVTGTDGTDTHLTRTVHHSGDHIPGVSYRVDGGVLVLTLRCGSLCGVDFAVEAPHGVTVTGRTDSGDVTLDGVSTVDVSTGSGGVSVRDVPGDVTVRTGSGDVVLAGLGGTVDVGVSSGSVKGTDLGGRTTVNSSSGDITLRLTQARDVQVDASSGDVRLTVPAGGYRVKASAGSGDTTLNVTDDPAAAHLIDVHTHSGDITVNPG